MTTTPRSPSSPIRHRASLDSIPTYKPGRTAAGPSADSAGAGPVVKLSSNELAYPPLPSVVAALQEAATTVNRYPDFHKTALAERLAALHDVAPAQVCVDNGSGMLLQTLAHITSGAGDEIVYPWRSFEGYPIAVLVAGARPVPVPLDPETWAIDVAAMRAAVTDRTRLIMICSPNNPTGPAVPAAAVGELLAAVPSDVAVAIDEAYVEFADEPGRVDGIELARRHSNVVALRTFSKAYGLAGLRVGYAVGHEDVITLVRKATVGFSVSTLGQAGALASLTHEAQRELRDRVATVIAERTRVQDALRSLDVSVVASQGNFVFMPMSGAADRAAALEAHGVILRPFDEGLRVTIGLPEENDRFLAAMTATATTWA